VLVDAGDLIEGNLFAGYFAERDSQRPHPVVDALNAMQYDVATPGNHEFDFGPAVLARATGDATYHYVSANIFKGASDTLASLAQKWRAESDAIIEFNLLRHPETLPVDEYLMLPYGVGPEPASVPQPNAQTVTAGKRSWYVTPVYSSGGASYPFGQCTWYVNTRRAAPWGGNAWQWFGRARTYGRPEGPTPRVGAIMVTWESPYWGHVAYVEQVYADGSWLVSEMNYASPTGGGWGRVSYRHVIPGTVPLIGFIY